MKHTNKDYWDDRYGKRRMNSGSGSYGEEGELKANEIIGFAHQDIESILDVGCGDLNIAQKIMPHFPKAKYLGLDVSEYIIEKNKKMNLGDRWEFKMIDTFDFDHPSDLVICSDVLFHIMDDNDYSSMLEALKRNWKKYLFISTYNHKGDKKVYSSYITAREFDPLFFSDHYFVTPTSFGNKIETSHYKFIK